jgi:hypothetical protein
MFHQNRPCARCHATNQVDAWSILDMLQIRNSNTKNVFKDSPSLLLNATILLLFNPLADRVAFGNNKRTKSTSDALISRESTNICTSKEGPSSKQK